jgi:hypothetical protein
LIHYYTALVISYAINGEPVKSVVWYDRERYCVEAMNDRLFDPVYDHLYELYGTDIMMECYVSDKVSFKLRPKLRPKEESDG